MCLRKVSVSGSICDCGSFPLLANLFQRSQRSLAACHEPAFSAIIGSAVVAPASGWSPFGQRFIACRNDCLFCVPRHHSTFFCICCSNDSRCALNFCSKFGNSALRVDSIRKYNLTPYWRDSRFMLLNTLGLILIVLRVLVSSLMQQKVCLMKLSVKHYFTASPYLLQNKTNIVLEKVCLKSRMNANRIFKGFIYLGPIYLTSFLSR